MSSELVARELAYYATGATRSYGFRKEALAKLAGGLETHQEALYQALQEDLNPLREPLERGGHGAQ